MAKKIKEYFGQCGYHWGPYTTSNLRAVQLTPNGKEWQHAIVICANCRKQLRGHFRYAAHIASPYSRVG